MGIAAQVAAWGRKWPSMAIGPARGASRPGRPFLTDLFPNGLQNLEAAFGADLNADPDTWTWTALTTRAFWEDGADIVIGTPNETPGLTPSSFGVKLRNDDEALTLGNPFSIYWPNVIENVPIRATLDIGSGPSIRFWGSATAWAPSWDDGRELAIVTLAAHGASRRIRQGSSTPQSPMWRWNMLSDRYDPSTNPGWPNADQGYHDRPAHYFPLEEGAGALQAANAIDSAYPMRPGTPEEVPRFGLNADLSCTKPAPQFVNGTTLSVAFPLVRPGGRCDEFDLDTYKSVRVQFLVQLPDSASTSLKANLGDLLTGGGAEMLRINVMSRSSIIGTAPPLTTVTYFVDNDPTDGLIGFCNLVDTAGTILNTLGGTPIGFQWERGVFVTIDLIQISVNQIEVRMGHIPLTADPATGVITSVTTVYGLFDVASAVLLGVAGFSIGLTRNLEGASVSHLSVTNGANDTFPDRYPHALVGRAGDRVDERLRRLGIENNVRIDITGDADITMGPQGIAGFLDLVGEGVAVDQGLLLDGLGPGLTYLPRLTMYSRAASLVLDADLSQILRPQVPQADDQGRVNVYTARNPAGGEHAFEQTDGPLGTDAVGTYDTGGDHRTALDNSLLDIAAWKTNLGTRGRTGLQYPRLMFQLAKPGTAMLAQQWLDMLPAQRLDALALEPGKVIEDRMFLLRSWREQWNSKLWTITANTSSYDPYAVGIYADDTGDDGEFVIHYDTDAGTSTLRDPVAAGAASLVVVTTGLPWINPALSTYADDLSSGFYVLVDGLRIKVTAVAGAASPQTFTVDPATVRKALSAGAPVEIWQPPIVGL